MKIVSKVFNSALNGICRSMKGNAVKLQSLIVDSINHYVDPANNSDTSYLGMIVNKLNDGGVADARKVRNYIEAHCNVTFTTIKTAAGEKQNVFKRCKGDASAIITSTPVIQWNEWAKAEHAAKPIDESAYIDKSIKSLQGYINKGRVIHPAKARKAVAALEEASRIFHADVAPAKAKAEAA